MALEWNEKLSVGFDLIDKEHKELFKAVNNLMTACNEGKGLDELSKTLNFLGNYVVTHFSNEERVMSSYNYPGLAEQVAEHKAFIEKFTELKGDFEKSGGNVLTILHANRFLVDWLMNHISKMDKKIGEFINNNK